jgi:hypothetical protein
MVEQYVRRPCVVARLRASPFASELDALAVYLGARGYRSGAIVRYQAGYQPDARGLGRGVRQRLDTAHQSGPPFPRQRTAAKARYDGSESGLLSPKGFA